MKTGNQRGICTPMFTRVLFTVDKCGNNLNVNSRRMHKEMCYMYAMDYYSPMRKKDNPAVYYNTDGT